MKIFAINSETASWLVAAETAEAAGKLLPKGSVAKETQVVVDSFAGEPGLLGSAAGKFVRENRIPA